MKTKVFIIAVFAIIVLTYSKTFGEMLVPDGSKCATPPPLLKHPKEMGIPSNANSLKTKVVGRLSILLDGMNTSEFSRENMGKRRITYFNPLATATITAEGGERRTYYVPSSIPASYFPDTIEEYQYGEGKVIREAEPNQVDTLSRRDMAVARFFSDSTIVVYAVVRNGKWVTSYINIGTPGVIRDMMEPYVPVEVAITILGGNDTKVDYPTQDREQVVSIHRPSNSSSSIKEADKPTINNDKIPKKSDEKESLPSHSPANSTVKSQETIQEDSWQALMSRFEKALVDGDRQLYSDCFADEFFGTYNKTEGGTQSFNRTDWINIKPSEFDREFEILKTKQIEPKVAIIYFYISWGAGGGRITDPKIIDYLSNRPPHKMIYGENVITQKLSPKMCFHHLFCFKTMELNGKWQFVECLGYVHDELSKSDNKKPLVDTSSIVKSQDSEQARDDQKAKRFNELMSYARARKNREQAREAMRALEEALVLHPDNGEALSLRKELESYYGSSPGNIIINSIGMKLVYIPPGEFMMGSPSNEQERNPDEGPQHKVKISNGFYMGVYELTQAQYQSVMGTNPSSFKGDNLPVEQVSWNDAVEFCRKLSQKEGKNYRLPTEAEWEYACRAGTTTEFYCYSESILYDYAWYKSNSYNQTHPVGHKKPNAFGLYDMYGNVSEWCQDWYDENYYNNSPEFDPLGPSSGNEHVIRGGSYYGNPSVCRSAWRFKIKPEYILDFSGFRIVMEFQATSVTPLANLANALSPSPTASDSEKIVELGNGVKMNFILIPPGEFMMGSPSGEKDGIDSMEGPQHQVKISKGFYMGIYEVTQAQYQAVIGQNPSYFKGNDLPVEKVVWDDAVEFCKKLSQKEGRTYRLPTEAEWEYACRAGTITRFYYGDDLDCSQLGEYAWYRDSSGNTTHPVGQKKPNAFGLYDMHGNVSEWCSDWADYYSNIYSIDPQGPSSGIARIFRGGSWDNPYTCRSAFRNSSGPYYRYEDMGFRVVLESE